MRELTPRTDHPGVDSDAIASRLAEYTDYEETRCTA
jgi:hypothetical protein